MCLLLDVMTAQSSPIKMIAFVQLGREEENTEGEGRRKEDER